MNVCQVMDPTPPDHYDEDVFFLILDFLRISLRSILLLDLLLVVLFFYSFNKTSLLNNFSLIIILIRHYTTYYTFTDHFTEVSTRWLSVSSMRFSADFTS